SRFFAEAHRGWGAEVLLGTGVTRILGNGKVSSIETSDGRLLPADLVVVGIGVLPNGELAEAAGLAADNGIVVDEHLLTADPTIRGCSVSCYRAGRLLGVESVTRPGDHMVARRLLLGDPQLSPPQTADPDFDLRAHAAALAKR